MVTITELTAPKMVIKKESFLIDWQKKVSETKITIAPDQSLTYFLIQGLGNSQERHIEITLREGSSITFFGLIVAGDANNLKTNVRIFHAEPSATSHIVLKGIVTGTGEALINGDIVIEKNGQKADAYLEERVLLLSETARAETLPHLEILADDVKASHAATLGRVSDEELFYLETRGIDRIFGERLIVNAFFSSQLAALPDQKLRGKISAAIEKLI